MFGLDDILLLPVRGLLCVCNEIADAADQQISTEADSIHTQLRELYMSLETGRINEDEFDAREAQLLDKLDALGGRGEPEEQEGSP